MKPTVIPPGFALVVIRLISCEKNNPCKINLAGHGNSIPATN